MKAEIISVASSKGGSGKTIITASIASFLCALGKKCLIIDCDAATHGMSLLYLENISNNVDPDKKGLFELNEINSLLSLDHSIIQIENNIHFLPATYNFPYQFDPESNFNTNILLNILGDLRFKYDFIFLDAQAGSDKYSKLTMQKNISDQVLIVSEYDPLSAAGIERLKLVIGEDLDYSRVWILLNKMLPEFVDKYSDFMTISKYLPPIPWNADIVRSYAQRKLAIDLENGNVFTLSIMKVVKELFGKKVENDIKEWRNNKVYALREPVEDQYVNAEKELEFLYESKKKHEYEYRMRRARYVTRGVVFLSLSITIFVYLFGYLGNLISIDLDTSPILEYLFSNKIYFYTFIIPILVSLFMMPLSKAIVSMKSGYEDSKFERQINVIEKELELLEAMRKADYETLINSINKK